MEDSNKIVKIPITFDQRKINKYGSGHVPCQISGRWLQVSETIEPELGFVFLDVMTNDDHKICEMCVKVEDIQRALNNAITNTVND